MSLLAKARILIKSCNIVQINFSSLNNFRAPSIVHNVKIFASPAGQLRFNSSDSGSHIETIYEGKLSKKIKYVKIFSLSTSLMSILVQPYLLPKVLATQSTAAVVGVSLMTCFFALGTPLMLNLITSKYVTKIRYDSKRNVYIATIYNIFVREREIEFIPDDVTKRGLGEIMTSCYIHDKPLFFDAHDFTDINHYSIIMGYDKPIDFELDNPPNSVSEKKPKKDN